MPDPSPVKNFRIGPALADWVGISKFIPKKLGISQFIPKKLGISQFIPKKFGISQFILKKLGISPALADWDFPVL